MKHTITTSLLLALLMAGCNDNFNPTTEKGREAGQKAITFMLPAANGSATRAASLSPDAHEKNISSVMVYMFDVDGRLEQTFSFAATDLTTSGDNHLATLHLDEFKNGLKHFYFVVNDADASATKLGNLTLSIWDTTEKDFIKARQTISTGYIKYDGNDLKLPMYGTDSKDDEYITIKDVAYPDKTPYTVKLKRSVARFDVVNDTTASHFLVKEIVVAGAKQNGLVFPAARPDSTAAALGTNITIGTLTENANKTNIHTSTPEFYLLPTQLKDTTTQIWVKGEYTSPITKEKIDKVIAVQPPVSKPPKATDDDIVKNTLYMITVSSMQPDSITAQITVADWDDSRDLEANVSRDMSMLSISEKLAAGETTNGVYTVGTNGKPDTYVNYTPPIDKPVRFTARFSMLSSMMVPIIELPKGSNFTLEVGTGSPQYVEKPKPHYEMDIDIVFPYYSVPVNNDTITIKDKNHNVLRQIVVTAFRTVYYNSNAYPVMLDTLWWAPVNVGATTLPAEADIATTPLTEATVGHFFQWGRTDSPFFTNTTFTIEQGPVAFASAIPGVFYKALVVQSKVIPNWATDQTGNEWAENSPYQPCPTGWRLPVENELKNLVNKGSMIGSGTVASPFWQYFTSSDGLGSKLYIPVAGRINPGTGNASYVPGDSFCALYIWGSDTSIDNNTVMSGIAYMANNNNSPKGYVDNDPASSANNIRCVRSTKSSTP